MIFYDFNAYGNLRKPKTKINCTELENFKLKKSENLVTELKTKLDSLDLL